MTHHIRPGAEFLLDGKTTVKVIKSLNRSNTSFIVETPDRSIISVEKERLHPTEQSKPDPEK